MFASQVAVVKISQHFSIPVLKLFNTKYLLIIDILYHFTNDKQLDALVSLYRWN